MYTHKSSPWLPIEDTKQKNTGMPATTTAETLALTSTQVIVHPLVLLSAVDHYNRVAKGTRKRVVGILLGQNSGSTINVANSFAVPFEEDDKDPSVWFLDHTYIDDMYTMFKKINAREKVIGWYHTGPKLRGSDLSINKLLRNYIQNPILVIVHINSASSDPTLGIPTDAYFAIEEIKDDGTTTSETFVHIPSLIEAEEAEEIGVEHLLHDLKESTGDLATRITSQLESLRGLESRLREVAVYLGKVLKGELPFNHAILEVLQDVFNLLPNLSPTPEAGGVGDLERSFRVKTNDQLMCIYLSSMIRAVLALHDLIDSGVDRKKEEKKEEKKDEKTDDKKDEEKKVNGTTEEKKSENPK